MYFPTWKDECCVNIVTPEFGTCTYIITHWWSVSITCKCPYIQSMESPTEVTRVTVVLQILNFSYSFLCWVNDLILKGWLLMEFIPENVFPHPGPCCYSVLINISFVFLLPSCILVNVLIFQILKWTLYIKLSAQLFKNYIHKSITVRKKLIWVCLLCHLCCSWTHEYSNISNAYKLYSISNKDESLCVRWSKIS